MGKFQESEILLDSVKLNEYFCYLSESVFRLVASFCGQMLFNLEKCKCLHTERGNTGVNYEIGGTNLCKTVKEKDLGVTINANMKVSEQCRIAASKGNHYS